MKEFMNWIRLHPCKALAFLAWSVACGAIIAIVDAALGMSLLCICMGVWMVVFTLDSSRFLSLLVATSLLAVPVARTQEFKPAAPFVIGGVVIIVAAGLGFVSCRAVKACRKLARGRTNAEPEELKFAVAGGAGGGEYGASFMWQESGYCAAERLVPVTPTVFTLDISVESVSNATVTMSAATGHEFVQSWGELQDEMESHGLAVTAGLHFSRNRHPADPEQVPITFNAQTRTVTLGSGGVLVTVERSTDLREWTTLLALDVEAGGTPLKIEDASAGACFYRVTTREP